MLAEPKNGWSYLQTMYDDHQVSFGPISYMDDAPKMMLESFMNRLTQHTPIQVTFDAESDGYVDIIEIDNCLFFTHHFNTRDHTMDIHGTFVGFVDDQLKSWSDELIQDISSHMTEWVDWIVKPLDHDELLSMSTTHDDYEQAVRNQNDDLTHVRQQLTDRISALHCLIQ